MSMIQFMCEDKKNLVTHYLSSQIASPPSVLEGSPMDWSGPKRRWLVKCNSPCLLGSRIKRKLYYVQPQDTK